VALAPGPDIELEDLPEVVRAAAARPPLPAEMVNAVAPSRTLAGAKEEAEILRIREALRKHGNNRLRAAAELGISRMGLYKKLRKYGLFEIE
jgi:transcriptional regulator of acetoin/glycerol metabolism